ncbi:MAG: DUF1073 domain-containing protein [Elusimicrobiota bacterium]|jgi:phage-related protein (TIGR01555 family)|nr:DUF1073 domain-containing protein [Elusimicrobiota bacterium]
MNISITQAELNRNGGKQLEMFGKLFEKVKENKAITALKKDVALLKQSLKEAPKRRNFYFDDNAQYKEPPASLRTLAKQAVEAYKNKAAYFSQLAISSIKDAQSRQAVMDSFDSAFARVRSGDNIFVHSQFMGYPFLSSLSQDTMIQSGITTLSDELTRKWGKVVSTSKDSDDANIEIVNKKLEKIRTKFAFRQAANHTGFFGGCLVYLDIRTDNDDAEPSDAELETPLFVEVEGDDEFNTKKIKPWKLVGLRPIEPINITPCSFNAVDPLKADFYNPTHFYVLGRKIHRSRFLYFADMLPPQILKPCYMFFGIPLAQLAFDFVQDFYSNKDAVSRIVKKFSLLVLKMDTQNLLNMDEKGVEKRIATMAKYRDNDSVFVVSKDEEDTEQINTPLSGLKEIWYANLEMLPIAFKLPATKLLQISPSGFNSTGEFEKESFYDSVHTKQEALFGEPIKRLIDIICFSEGINPQNLSFEWASLKDMSDKEKAEIGKQKADTDHLYYQDGVITNADIAKRLSADKDSGYGGIDIPEEKPFEENGADGGEENPFEIDGAGAIEDENPNHDKDNGQFSSGGGGSGDKNTADFKEIKQNIINSLDKSFVSNAKTLINEAQNNINLDKGRGISFRKIDKQEADRLKVNTGLELEGHEHKITNSDIRHIFLEHGDDAREQKRGQIGVTPEDILLIPEITKNYDDVRLSSEKSENRDILMYEKKIGDKYYYFESVGGKKTPDLRPKSMFIKKRDKEKAEKNG